MNEKTQWHGRLEIVSRNPLIVLDGGHNPDGVKNLVDSINKLLPDKKLGIVYAVMQDKDYNSCLKLLSSITPDFYATEVPDMQRCLKAEDLLSACKNFAWRTEPGAFKSPLKAVEADINNNEVTISSAEVFI